MICHAQPIWICKNEERQGTQESFCEKNQYIEAKQHFVIVHKDSASLQICADTEYVVYLNGSLVGTGQYCCFRGTRAYDEYDVTGYITEGDNELFIAAYSAGEDFQTYQKDTPMLSFALVCGKQCVLSGEETMLRPHIHYKSGDIEKISLQLGYAFHYDAREKTCEWQQATVQPCTYHYIKRPVKKLVPKQLVEGHILTQGVVERRDSGTPAEMMQSDGMFYRDKKLIFSGKTVKKNPDGVYFVVDLENEYAGLLCMTLEATTDTVIDVGWGEHLEDLRVRTSVGGRNFACRYVCKSGKQEFTGFFRRMAGRYLQIHMTNMTGDVHFEHLGLLPMEYPLERIGTFWCNDYLFQRICQVAEHTLRMCMHEHYEDCPWREQALYGFDSYVQMLCGYYMFGEYDYAKVSLKLLAEGQREDGLLPLCAPAGVSLTIPCFSLIWIMSVEKYVLYSGDIAFGKEMLPVAEDILKAFRVENDLVQLTESEEHWHFYDWAEGLSGGAGGTDAIINCYYIMACEAYYKICCYGAVEINKEIPFDFSKMRAAIKKAFWEEKSGLFRTRLREVSGEREDCYHELTQVLAHCSGVTQDVSILDKVVGEGDGLIKVTLSTSLFKYEALLANRDRYIEAVTEEIADVWGKMLYSGTNTFWEVPEGASAFGNAGSLCHGWSAVPLYLLYKYYLGFEPETPGFDKYRLQPRFVSHITKIEALLLTPGWNKQVSYQKD